MPEERHVGAFRRYRSGLGGRSGEITYLRCQSCGLTFQDHSLGPRGLGSTTRQSPPLEQVVEMNRQQEEMRRGFRDPSTRCTCDQAGDLALFRDPGSAEEWSRRQGDFLRADANPAGWYADPNGAHQHRFWDGRMWTALVANNGVTSSAPYVVPSIPADAGQPRPATGRRKTGRPARKSASVDLAEQLRQLNDLHQAGALSKEQFEAAKNSLLGLDS